jgi:hypothetical protein
MLSGRLARCLPDAKGCRQMPSVNEIALPSKADPRWTVLVTHGPAKPVKMLALKFMLTRMSQEAHRDPSPGTIARNVDELHAFFCKNAHMTAADASQLFA